MKVERTDVPTDNCKFCLNVGRYEIIQSSTDTVALRICSYHANELARQIRKYRTDN